MQKTLRAFMMMTALVAVALPAAASEALKQIGVFGGVNLAKLKFDPEFAAPLESKMLLGPAVGIVGVLPVGDKGNIAVRVSPMWVQKGGKFDDGVTEVKEKWSYIEVPLYIMASTTSGKARPYAMVGPSVGFLLSAKEDDVDIKDDFESTSLSARIGAGVSVEAGRNHVFLEGEYELGLQNVIKDMSSFGDVEAKTNGIRIGAGVTFPLAGM
jgi:hypothetical protein